MSSSKSKRMKVEKKGNRAATAMGEAVLDSNDDDDDVLVQEDHHDDDQNVINKSLKSRKKRRFLAANLIEELDRALEEDDFNGHLFIFKK